MAGFHLGNVIGLLLTPIMLSTVGISGPFILFSSLGLLWLTRWANGVTSDPRDSPFVSKSELRLIQAGKTDSPANNSGQLPPLTSPIIKRSKLQGYFVLLSWMPIYFNTVSYYYLLSFILLTSKDHGESFVLKNQLL
jgi:ACS family sodium-dependent inorganic phosphate cotransporter